MSLTLTPITGGLKALATHLNAWKTALETKFNTTLIAGSEIQGTSINTAHLIDQSVTTAKIKDLNVTTGKLAANAATFAKVGDDVGQDFCISFSILNAAALGAGAFTRDIPFIPPAAGTCTFKKLMFRCQNNNAASLIMLQKFDGAGWQNCMAASLAAGGLAETDTTTGVEDTFEPLFATVDPDEPLNFHIAGDGTELNMCVQLWMTKKVQEI